jgi:PAS domain S-box-containing protein
MLPQLVWTCRADGPCDYLSPQWVAYTGIPEASQLGYGWLEQLHPEDRGRVMAEWSAAVPTGGPFDIEFRIRRHDGVYRWFRTRAVPMRDADGRVAKWFGSNTDIDDARQAEEALRRATEREHFLADVLENATTPFGCGLPDGQLLLFNRAFAELTGYTRDELEERRLTWATDLTPIEWRAMEAEILARAVRDRESVRYQKEYVRKDGTRVPIELFVQPVFGDDGALAHYRAFVVDITERKRAEAEILELNRTLDQRVTERTAQLQAVHQRIRSLVEAMDDSVFIVDRDRRVVAAYGGRAGGGESAGAALHEELGPESAGMHGLMLERALRGESVMYDWTPEEQAGRRHFQTRLSPIRDDEGTVTGVVGVARELTELRKAREQLQVSDRMATVGTLAAGVAHEINNPLSVIMGNLQIAVRGLESLRPWAGTSQELGEVAAGLGDALAAAARVRDIVRDLSVFSRGGETEPGSEEVDLHRVLDFTLRMCGNEVRHRAHVVRDYGRVPRVKGSESRLGQVFLNLVLNAAQAIPEGHAHENEVRIGTRTDAEGRAMVEIADTGAGMTPEVLGRLFTPFFTTKPVGVGTGLGLAICHRIVDSLGGEIRLRSEVGRGSAVTVVLPAQQQGPVLAQPGPQPAQAAASRRGSVLVVDDEPMVLRAIERALCRDHQVTAVTRASDALGLIAGGGRFDVILCDLLMPEMSGMDLYTEVRRVAPEQASRMVFVTGAAFTPGARAFLDEVDNERLEKPVQVEQLLAVVGARVK